MNGLGAFGFPILQAGLEGIQSKAVVCVPDCADNVDASLEVSMGSWSEPATGWWLSQHGPAGHTGPFPGTQVLPSDHQGQDDGVNEVSEGKIEGPQELDATRAVAHMLQLGLGICDLGGEGRERLLELGRGEAIALFTSSGSQWRGAGFSASTSDQASAYLPGPNRHHVVVEVVCRAELQDHGGRDFYL